MIPLAAKGKNPKEIRNLLIGLALAAGLFVGLRMIYVHYTAVDYRGLNDAEWKITQVGIPYLQFESPVALKDMSRPPLGQEHQFIKRSQSFIYDKGLDLYIHASVVDYLPHVFVDPAAAIVSVKNFDKQFGASNITYEPVELVIGSYKTLRVDGSFTKNDRKYVFSRITCEYRTIYRDLLVIVRDEDQEALLVKNRMVGTIFFEPQ